MNNVNVLSVRWWLNMFINVFVTMCFIYLIKKLTAKYNVPVVSNIAAEV